MEQTAKQYIDFIYLSLQQANKINEMTGTKNSFKLNRLIELHKKASEAESENEFNELFDQIAVCLHSKNISDQNECFSTNITE